MNKQYSLFFYGHYDIDNLLKDKFMLCHAEVFGSWNNWTMPLTVHFEYCNRHPRNNYIGHDPRFVCDLKSQDENYDYKWKNNIRENDTYEYKWKFIFNDKNNSSNNFVIWLINPLKPTIVNNSNTNNLLHIKKLNRD